MYNLRVSDGVHNWTWHPTEPVAWVSTGDLPGGLDHLPIIDFANVHEPRLVSDGQVEGGPHDITFSSDGAKGYIGSENNVRVYDTRDPRSPTLLYRGPTIASYVHGADPTPDGKTLLVTDESLVLGGFFAGSPAPQSELKGGNASERARARGGRPAAADGCGSLLAAHHSAGVLAEERHGRRADDDPGGDVGAGAA